MQEPMAETLSTREAAILLRGWPDYAAVEYLKRCGKLRQIVVSPRKRRVLKLLAERGREVGELPNRPRKARRLSPALDISAARSYLTRNAPPGRRALKL